MNKKTILWILVILWCIFIFWQSSAPADESSGRSDLVTNIINSCISFFTHSGAAKISSGLVRKTAHLFEYTVLGAVLFSALCEAVRTKKAIILTIAAGCLYAVSDEIHQYFVPGRAMRITDVAIDTAGVIVAVLVMYYLFAGRRSDAIS